MLKALCVCLAVASWTLEASDDKRCHAPSQLSRPQGLRRCATSQRTSLSGNAASSSAGAGNATDQRLETDGGPKRPHIVLVILDDVGWNTIEGFNEGVSGNEYARTPAMSAAIAEGVRLRQLYVTPMCSPTRAAVLTGRFPYRYGAQSFVQKPFMPTFLPEHETTLADKLLQAGYSTALVGKWHLGYGLRKYTPTARGFQRFFGSYEVGGDHFAHTVGHGSHAMGLLFYGTDGVGQTLDLHRESSRSGRRQDSHEYVTDQQGVYSAQMFAREAVAEINAAASASQPLFLYLAFTTIHTPLQVPDAFVALNAHISGSVEARINAGMMSAMDAAFGDVVSALKAQSMWQNTVLVCFSDNGAMVTQGASNFPLRGNKMGPFEGGIRSPGFLTGGHRDLRQAAGSVYNGLLHVVDVHTMLLHVADADPSFARATPQRLDAVDGAAVWEGVTKSGAAPRTEFIALLDPLGTPPWLNEKTGWSLVGKCSAVRSGKWKLIKGYPGRDDWYAGDPGKCFSKLAHEGTVPHPPNSPECPRGDLQYELISSGFQPKDTWLFDIEADPLEKSDLSASHPGVVEELQSKLDRASAESVPPFPDRWDTLAGMMSGIHHTMDVGGGYSAGLTSWQEPVHLEKIGFFRRAKQYLRLKAAHLGMRLAEGRTTKTSSAPQSLFPRAVAAGEEGLDETVDVSLNIAMGRRPDAMIGAEELAALWQELSSLEAAYSNPGRAPAGIPPPRSRL